VVLQIEVFCEAVPKAAEVTVPFIVQPWLIDPTFVFQNFLALCASNYYDGCLFHRNIKGFMVQTGDPSGSGKGGQSIWGELFADELRSTLKVLTPL
jgi:peptidyl-prolyl cis-trans isomerase-like 3